MLIKISNPHELHFAKIHCTKNLTIVGGSYTRRQFDNSYVTNSHMRILRNCKSIYASQYM